jgi:hypothetical protein
LNLKVDFVAANKMKTEEILEVNINEDGHSIIYQMKPEVSYKFKIHISCGDYSRSLVYRGVYYPAISSHDSYIKRDEDWTEKSLRIRLNLFHISNASGGLTKPVFELHIKPSCSPYISSNGKYEELIYPGLSITGIVIY